MEAYQEGQDPHAAITSVGVGVVVEYTLYSI